MKRGEVVSRLEAWADEMEREGAGWSPRQPTIAPARAAVEEVTAILRDAAVEVMKSTRERVTA
jgi:hypothetical protein